MKLPRNKSRRHKRRDGNKTIFRFCTKICCKTILHRQNLQPTPPTSNTPKETTNEWQKPPMEQKVQKQPKPSLTLNFNDKRQVQQYSDILRGTYVETNNGVQMSIQNMLGTISAGNNDGIHNIIPSTQMVAKKGTNNGNNTAVTKSQLSNFLDSKEFQETLAKIVAPQVRKQVNDLITPSVEKLDVIESQVKSLHDYVHDNKQWQNQQSNRQMDYKNN